MFTPLSKGTQRRADLMSCRMSCGCRAEVARDASRAVGEERSLGAHSLPQAHRDGTAPLRPAPTIPGACHVTKPAAFAAVARTAVASQYALAQPRESV